MQAQDGPALELSDIMHPMSPSPPAQIVALPPETKAHLPHPLHPPHDDSVFALQSGGAAAIHIYDAQGIRATPEPLDQAELESMRHRVQQLGFGGPGHAHPNATPLEKELASMILRLTSDPILQPSSTQLASQAETIATLTLQCNLLLQAKNDEGARWGAARQGWERSAEALIRKQLAAAEPAARHYEAERALAELRDENVALRHKLSDTHSRLSVLESELSRLRPLITLQTNFIGDPEVLEHASLARFAPSEDRPDHRKKVKKLSDRVKRENEVILPAASQAPAAEADADNDAMEGIVETAPSAPSTNGHKNGEVSVRPQDLNTVFEDTKGPGPSRRRMDFAFAPASHAIMPPPALKSSTARHAEKHGKGKEKRARFKAPGPRTPLLTDARAECVLTAARKIGRVRAGIAAGLVKERRREERQAEAARKAQEEAQRASGVVLQPDWHNAWAPGEGEPGPSNYQGAIAGPSSITGSAAAQARNANGQQLTAHMYPTGPYQLTGTPPQVRVAPGTVPAHPYAMPGLVYVQAVPSPPPGGRAAPAQVPQGAMMVPVWPMQGPGTPPAGRQQASGVGRGRGAAQGGNGRAQGAPATPLDSLLSAATVARTMMVDDDGQENGGGAGEETEKEEDEGEEEEEAAPVAKRALRRRSAAAVAAADRPVPKRRRVGAAASASASAGSLTAARGATGRTRRQTRAALAQAQELQDQVRAPPDRKGKGKQRDAPAQPAQGKGKGKAATNGVKTHHAEGQPAPAPIARVRSALDVLADQAAQEQERMPASGPGSRRESAEPDKERRRVAPGPGPRTMSKTQTSGSQMETTEGREDPGPEEEEGVSDADAEGDLDADADGDADADAEGSEDTDLVESAADGVRETAGAMDVSSLQAAVQHSEPTTVLPTMSTRTRQIEPIDVSYAQAAETSRRADASQDINAGRP